MAQHEKFLSGRCEPQNPSRQDFVNVINVSHNQSMCFSSWMTQAIFISQYHDVLQMSGCCPAFHVPYYLILRLYNAYVIFHSSIITLTASATCLGKYLRAFLFRLEIGPVDVCKRTICGRGHGHQHHLSK